MRKLSKYEKETIINWNEAENLASVYTFNASLKRRLILLIGVLMGMRMFLERKQVKKHAG